jgi:hypothetical protein
VHGARTQDSNRESAGMGRIPCVGWADVGKAGESESPQSRTPRDVDRETWTERPSARNTSPRLGHSTHLLPPTELRRIHRDEQRLDAPLFGVLDDLDGPSPVGVDVQLKELHLAGGRGVDHLVERARGEGWDLSRCVSGDASASATSLATTTTPTTTMTSTTTTITILTISITKTTTTTTSTTLTTITAISGRSESPWLWPQKKWVGPWITLAPAHSPSG